MDFEIIFTEDESMKGKIEISDNKITFWSYGVSDEVKRDYEILKSTFGETRS